mmetsp:Transcript_26360/g.52524  ORF Transcript_26360/g.52524 Transcript_26360/m.52524 type:complete len:211 (+) Transcript_26360:371-1003(+)
MGRTLPRLSMGSFFLGRQATVVHLSRPRAPTPTNPSRRTLPPPRLPPPTGLVEPPPSPRHPRRLRRGRPLPRRPPSVPRTRRPRHSSGASSRSGRRLARPFERTPRPHFRYGWRGQILGLEDASSFGSDVSIVVVVVVVVVSSGIYPTLPLRPLVRAAPSKSSERRTLPLGHPRDIQSLLRSIDPQRRKGWGCQFVEDFQLFFGAVVGSG